MHSRGCERDCDIGAGKTTFAREFLPAEAGLPVFINADLIAAGFSPFDPGTAAFRAGRMMLQEIDRHAAMGRSFAFETTLAGHTYVRGSMTGAEVCLPATSTTVVRGRSFWKKVQLDE
jgi:predicted ABC-type ATPase